MGLPAIGDGEQVGDGNLNEGLLVGRSGQPVGFFGVTPIAKPANAAQAALTVTTATSAGFGFLTSAGFNAFVAQLENIRANLVLLGLLKGTA